MKLHYYPETDSLYHVEASQPGYLLCLDDQKRWKDLPAECDGRARLAQVRDKVRLRPSTHDRAPLSHPEHGSKVLQGRWYCTGDTVGE